LPRSIDMTKTSSSSLKLLGRCWPALRQKISGACYERQDITTQSGTEQTGRFFCYVASENKRRNHSPPLRLGPNSVGWRESWIDNAIDSFETATPREVAPGVKKGRKPRWQQVNNGGVDHASL